MSITPQHAAWSQVPVEPMNALLDRQFLSGANLTISRITLRKGAIVPRHSHANEQAACLLSGDRKSTRLNSSHSS